MRMPWQRLADRLYGPARPGAFAEAAGDSLRWARADHAIELAGMGIVLVGAVLLFADVRTVALAASGLYTILALYGLWLVVVQTGQPSLGHAAFMGIGAYLTAFLRLAVGLDGVTSAVIAALACGAAGWGLGRGTSRLRPAFVALATWAFGWLVSLGAAAFPARSGITGGISFRAPTEVRVDSLGLDVRFNDAGHLLAGLALLLVAMLLLRSAQRSRIGRGWAAVREQPAMAAAVGLDVAATRRRALAWGAGIGGLAGSMLAQSSGVVDPATFSPLVSLQLFAAVLIGLPAGFLGPVMGYAVTVLLPSLSMAAAGVPSDSRIQGVVVALLTMVALTISLGRRWSRPPAAEDASGTPLPEEGPAPAPAAGNDPAVPALQVTGLRRAFGGVRALDGVSLAVAAGEIHALIGPNGSGKSTLLRCIAGTIAADAGEVLVSGRSVLGLPAPERVAAGVARTFQRPVVFGELDPEAQVELALAWEGGRPGWLRTLARTPSVRALDRERRRRAAVAVAELRRAGGGGALAAGQLRRLQVAIALATDPTVLLLDEPVAGMDAAERRDFVAHLRAISRGGVAIVVAAHDLAFIREVADRATVVAGGVEVATGTPAQVVRDPAVRRAYLGG
jgi:branched-chain amino acid transport system permease protein